MSDDTKEGASQQPERDIFRFHDGKRQRAVDPMKIWFAMHSDTDIDLSALIDRMMNNEMEATKELLVHARQWIGIPEYDGDTDEGMTDLEFCRVWYAWLTYVVELKKKRGQLPIPSRVLEQLRRGSPSVPNFDSGSSSMPSESQNEGPTNSSTPSPQPSEQPLAITA